MKKVRYSFISLLLAVFFVVLTTSANAQIYSHPVHRSKFFYNENGDGISNLGGTATTDWRLTLLQLSSRGVTLLGESIDQASFKIYPNYPGGEENCGYLCDSYYSCSEEAEVLAGETLEIKGESENGWSNAALYIDWDGNGVFDDHDLLQYNIYNESCNVQEEYHNADGLTSIKMTPSWSIKLPNLAEERVVRFRIKYDEGVRHIVERRRHEIYDLGVPGCSNDGHDNGSGPLNNHRQYFFSFVFNRFMPSANPFRGTTIDFDVRIKPNEFISQTIESKSIVSEVGTVVCESVLGTAISDEAGFEAFLNATSGNFYLANDITISSTLDVSQAVFGGIFDGNGHTITINPATTTKGFNEKSKNACFYPYGTNQDVGVANEIRNNIATYDFAKSTVSTTTFPEKVIGGGFCGVLASEGVIKNVKVVYEKSCTYQASGAALFGLVAGVVNGRVENVSIDIKGGSTVKVESNGTTVGACGGVTGVLFRGVVKNCAVNVNGTLSFGKNSGTLPRESALGGLIGRLQAGVVGSVKFSGNGTLALGATKNTTYSRYYIGGIAGMTNTPQGAFCGEFQYEWGYDNGTTGLDVNNVILSFTGAMDMGAANAGTTHNYYCRGLLFAEATDSTTVPNLITQYANALTIEKSADANQSISGTSIPLISTTAGNCGTAGKLISSSVKNSVGKLYLYKDGRIPDNETLCAKYTNVTTADTELNWAYEVQNIRDEAGNVTCVAFSTPYAVATYTGTNANIQGIEAASANVSDLGSAVVKVDPQPETEAAPSWTWSETASPATPNTDSPVCGGGGGETIAPLLTTYCSSMGRTSDEGIDRGISNISLNGSSVTINEYSSNSQDAYRGTKNNEASAIELAKGSSYTLTVNGSFIWQYISCFADWNADGDFSDSNERIGLFPSTVHQFGGTGAETDYRDITINVPSDAASAYIPLRIKMAYSTNNNETAVGTPDPCTLGLYKEQINQAVAVDVVLKVTGGSGGGNTTTYCAQPTFTNNGTTPPATGYLQNLTANGTALATNWSYDKEKNVTGNTITINQGESLTLDFQFNSQHADKMQWTTALAFVDLNGDGSFTEDERIYAKGGVGWQSSAIGYESLLVDGISNDKPWTSTKTVNFAPTATSSLLRIFTVGEWGINCETKAGSKSISTSACANGGVINGDEGANKFHCYDFPIVINAPATGGDGCAYVANFGNVYAGDVATYDIKLGAGATVTIDNDVADDEYTLTTYNDATGILTVTYNVPATPGAVAVDSIGGITKDGDVYRIAVSATVKAAPTVTFRMSDEGGGALSLDMGKSTFIEPRTLAPYKGNLLTAVPVGPTHIVGWFVSTDGGTTFNAVGHANPDYIYTGTDDAIVEVRFDFDDFEGDFGLARFTDNTNPPFYITSVKATGGIVNIVGANGTDAVPMFTDDVVGGEVRFMYKEDARLQTLIPSLKTMSHEVTVTLTNGTTVPADARLLCFIDYNMNNYFDFTSSPDGLASALTKNNELVYVGTPNGNADQTFTFTISNTDVTKFGKTRMRFMVATYVDMYGLGPVNQYGNYQPRIDTDGDGFADQELPLNDNNGKLYDPNNQCRYENYVNVADVTFEVVAYVRYNDKYTIKNGESVRMNNLYVEAQEDANGFHAGQIVFDKNAPYGSLIVEGNIILRRRIYPDKWHDVAFPIEMQGVGGQDGICAVGANGALAKLPATGKHLVYEFDPAGRNQTGGYGGGTKLSADATFQKNKFYEFAADVPDGFTANDAGADIDGVSSYWIQFHSVDKGFIITPSAAKTATLSYVGAADAVEYNNKNVFTLYNPFLSNINVNEITASLGWENITWWNAIQNRYMGVSAADTRDMSPYFGYWIQFTEDIATGDPVSILLGDASRDDYPYADDRIVNFGIKSASAANTSTFDTPDAYTLGIDHVSKAINKNATSTTIVTLTDAGSIDDFRAGYDMPVSLSNVSSSIIPEIWSKAGASRMMFNDVMRDDEVVVPVGIRIKEAGEYVVRLTHTNHTASLVQLYDKQTGAKVDLQRNGELFTYSFLAEQGDAERFDLIIIAPNAMTDLDAIASDEELSGATIYNVGNTLHLVNLPLGYTVAVCDVVGRELMQTKVVDADMQLQLPNNQGVYLVNVRNENGSSVQVVKLTR
ncbi:MAG: hypothetical protein IKU78_02240 [Paludibacteraceae bacterium]|nr:hypothetical protein [Paludibacteraceae bacterium]